MIKAVLFDFDGVIANSEIIHMRSFQELLAPLGIKISIKRWFTEFTGTGSRYVVEKLFNEYKINQDVQIWLDKRKKLYLSYVKKGLVKPKAGAVELVKKLRKQDILVAIVSNSHSPSIQPVLENFGLTDSIDLMICGEDVKNKKPAPDGYLLAAKRLNLQVSECVCIEDSKSGMVSVKAAGMKLVCLRTAACTNYEKCDAVVGSLRRFPIRILTK
ncbi:MAG: HAD family phosphatase [Candidatus Micrarchaeota archaeon]